MQAYDWAGTVAAQHANSVQASTENEVIKPHQRMLLRLPAIGKKKGKSATAFIFQVQVKDAELLKYFKSHSLGFLTACGLLAGK